jgi:hypothetical protein
MYDFKIVSNKWRDRYFHGTKSVRNTKPIDDPIIEAVLNGKTVVVDAHVPIDNKKNLPYKNLYNYLANRGMRLRMYVFDDIDLGIFRGLIMWAEPFVKVLKCSRCGVLHVTSENTKPSNRGCKSNIGFHVWSPVGQLQVEEKAA